MRGIVTGLFLLTCLPTTTEAKTYREMFGMDPSGDAKAQEVLRSLDFRQDSLALPGAHAQLAVPRDFYYLDAADTAKVITKLWGNPPDSAEGRLGMIFPARLPPENSAAWGDIVSYSDDGYISDADAESTDFNAVLKDLQDQTVENNAERQRNGYEPITLVGWASPPHYEKATHSFHWARDLLFGKDANAPHTLNYQLRILGREGVIEMNFVAGMNQLQEIKASIPAVTGLVTYDAAKKYDDHQDGDKIAAYGLAGLIATAAGAKVAAKIGLLALGFAFLKKGGIVLLFAAGAILRPIAKLFRKKPSDTPPDGIG